MAVFDYLSNLKRGLRLDFDAYFLHDSTIKCSSFNTSLSMGKVAMFSFSRYQTKFVITFFYLDS